MPPPQAVRLDSDGEDDGWGGGAAAPAGAVSLAMPPPPAADPASGLPGDSSRAPLSPALLALCGRLGCAPGAPRRAVGAIVSGARGPADARRALAALRLPPREAARLSADACFRLAAAEGGAETRSVGDDNDSGGGGLTKAAPRPGSACCGCGVPSGACFGRVRPLRPLNPFYEAVVRRVAAGDDAGGAPGGRGGRGVARGGGRGALERGSGGDGPRGGPSGEASGACRAARGVLWATLDALRRSGDFEAAPACAGDAAGARVAELAASLVLPPTHPDRALMLPTSTTPSLAPPAVSLALFLRYGAADLEDAAAWLQRAGRRAPGSVEAADDAASPEGARARAFARFAILVAAGAVRLPGGGGTSELLGPGGPESLGGVAEGRRALRACLLVTRCVGGSSLSEAERAEAIEELRKE